MGVGVLPVLEVSGRRRELQSGAFDAAAGRVTFPALLGLDGAKALAREKVERAVEAISGFGEEAGAVLRALARYTVERSR